MDDRTRLERRLAQAEELLNVVDALRPDLPADELYDLALQMLGGAGEYPAGSLWIYAGGRYKSVAWQGLSRERAGGMRGASLDALSFERMLDQFDSRDGAHWCRWPLSPEVPALLRSPGDAGHTLLLPLAYTDKLGFAALESPAPEPDSERLETLRRFADKIAVALDTARLVHEHLATIETLQRVTDEQRLLQETVLALSAPLLPLLPGVLVLPLIGAIDSPSPVISVVTPIMTLLIARGSISRYVSDWPSMSMKPGATTRPCASIGRVAVACESLPILTMRSPLIARSAT